MVQASSARFVLLLGLASGFFGCGSPVLEDLDNFCKVASDVKGKKGLETDARLKLIEDRSAEYAKVKEAPFATLWADFKSAPLEKRHELLVETAKQAGKPDWRCGSFEKLVQLSSVERAAAQKLAEEKAKASKAAAELALGEGGPGAGQDGVVKEKKKGKKRRARRRH